MLTDEAVRAGCKVQARKGEPCAARRHCPISGSLLTCFLMFFGHICSLQGTGEVQNSKLISRTRGLVTKQAHSHCAKCLEHGGGACCNSPSGWLSAQIQTSMTTSSNTRSSSSRRSSREKGRSAIYSHYKRMTGIYPVCCSVQRNTAALSSPLCLITDFCSSL